MQLRIYRKILDSVQSITDCTNPTIQVGKIRIEFKGLNSPYISKRLVNFSETTTALPEGIIFAQSSRHSLLIMGMDVESVPDEVYPPFSKKGVVHKWAGGTVPAHVVEPIFNLLSSELYLPTSTSTAIRAYILEPVVAGWYYNRPVFWLAAEGQNEPFRLPGRPDNYYPPYRQGNLLIGWADIEKPDIPVWQEGVWFLNHIIRPPGEHPDKTMDREICLDYASAVLFHGEPYLAVRVNNNQEIEILSRNCNSIIIPPAREGWVAIHPFPTGGID